MITEIFVNTYDVRMTVEAAFTSISRGNINDTYIKILVTRIERVGVLNRLLTLFIDFGNKLSLLNARGYRDADMIPAFAVVINARSDAIEMITNPGLPIIRRAESATGVKEFDNSSGSNIPVMIKTIRV
jgi:hypothetical protein